MDEVDFSKHAGVMAYFQKNYVRTGIFEKEYSKILTKAFEVRTESDYDDYYIISKAEVEDQISQAQIFSDGVSKYVEKRLSKEKEDVPHGR
ncbi:MAG: HEPN domain-containing protein [Clostridiales bacterium]|nr:HEPN domain-containing protein [Clostridiales bacterium]